MGLVYAILPARKYHHLWFQTKPYMPDTTYRHVSSTLAFHFTNYYVV